MQIYIIIDDERHFTIQVDPSDRVLYIKAKITELSGIPFDQQELLYQNTRLLNDDKLENYSIGECAALRLSTRNSQALSNVCQGGRLATQTTQSRQQFPSTQSTSGNIDIKVRSLTGKEIPLSINPNYYIEDIKNVIARKSGIPSCQQRLIFAGYQLEDGNHVHEYSIQNGSILHLILRLKGGKPVIYLYPEKDNFDVEVKVKMPKKEGEITSIYPVIKDEDHNAWIVKANKNGEIIHNNRKHDYLFWECLFTNPFPISEGFVIEGHECFEFFEEKLQYLGFKEREANDFITYWCPKMEHSKYVAICFQGEEYDKRVPLIVEPKPDYIKRVFMTFKLLDEKITLPLQDIEQFKIKERKGFFVFEWGGSQIY